MKKLIHTLAGAGVAALLSSGAAFAATPTDITRAEQICLQHATRLRADGPLVYAPGFEACAAVATAADKLRATQQQDQLNAIAKGLSQ